VKASPLNGFVKADPALLLACGHVASGWTDIVWQPHGETNQVPFFVCREGCGAQDWVPDPELVTA
jgi:hypothetical protein